MKYRKKPVVIEAERFDGTGVPAFCSNDVLVQFNQCEPAEDSFLSIDTLEGTMYAQPGDFIIRGIQGELYPCKPDIFAATYEEVPDAR